MTSKAEQDGRHEDHTVLHTLTETLARRFNIAHVTIQPETGAHAADCCDVVCEPAPVDAERGTRNAEHVAR